jgi:hypothetical protein
LRMLHARDNDKRPLRPELFARAVTANRARQHV